MIAGIFHLSIYAPFQSLLPLNSELTYPCKILYDAVKSTRLTFPKAQTILVQEFFTPNSFNPLHAEILRQLGLLPMMNNRITKHLTVGAIFAISGHASAEIFEYAKQFHVETAAQCEHEVKLLADKVAHLSDGKVSSTYCAANYANYFDASVFIDAPKIPRVELAIGAFLVRSTPNHNHAINRGNLVLDPESGYRDLSDCLANLPAMETIFMEETGLKVVSSQCFKEGTFHYISQVDGFGTTTKSLHELSLQFYDATADQAALAGIKQYLQAQGARVFLDTFRSSYVFIKYYAATPINLGAFDFHGHNTFATKDECLQAEGIITTAISQFNNLKLVHNSCLEASWSAGHRRFVLLSVFDFSPNETGVVNIDVKTVGRFSTFESCVAHRSTGPVVDYCAGSYESTGRQNGYELNRLN